MGIHAISFCLGHGEKAVRKALNLEAGEPLREDVFPISKDALWEAYWGPGSGYPSIAALSRRFQVRRETVISRFDRFGIKRRTGPEQAKIERLRRANAAKQHPPPKRKWKPSPHFIEYTCVWCGETYQRRYKYKHATYHVCCREHQRLYLRWLARPDQDPHQPTPEWKKRQKMVVNSRDLAGEPATDIEILRLAQEGYGKRAINRLTGASMDRIRSLFQTAGLDAEITATPLPRPGVIRRAVERLREKPWSMLPLHLETIEKATVGMGITEDEVFEVYQEAVAFSGKRN
jgi:hypothetical protein